MSQTNPPSPEEAREPHTARPSDPPAAPPFPVDELPFRRVREQPPTWRPRLVIVVLLLIALGCAGGGTLFFFTCRAVLGL